MLYPLPQDPLLLVSAVNAYLRDGLTLEALCEEADVTPRALAAKLEPLGFRYDPVLGRFS